MESKWMEFGNKAIEECLQTQDSQQEEREHIFFKVPYVNFLDKEHVYHTTYSHTHIIHIQPFSTLLQ